MDYTGFWWHITEITSTGCWRFGKSKSYPVWQGQTAHRVAYELANGEIEPQPDGKRTVIDHLCKERNCINPSHLEAVSDAESIRRGRGAKPYEFKCGHPAVTENAYRTQRRTGRRAGLTTTECRECKVSDRSKSYAQPDMET
jgi:hypothetical protein